ncbi:hypothetical protein HaLaN_24365 [Haematococcus lacustris]|uniref:Uncharacterized protein n=1 Tax=Haematococcus lacustris TaxID=44745 RepID=A0A699ZTP2_HAELA|nr:hypothetical protein HaLaN_24365 [Haematococcus lacustris]
MLTGVGYKALPDDLQLSSVILLSQRLGAHAGSSSLYGSEAV